MKVLQFFQVQDMYEEYFKVNMFNDVIKLIEFDGLEIRKEVVRLLQAKYTPK